MVQINRALNFVGTFSLVLIAQNLPLYLTSSCGESMVPFSFEALANGQPVLGCARPVCFGYDFNGQPIANGIKTAAFHQIRNQPDGYRRLILPSALPLPFKIESQYNKIYSPQISKCTNMYEFANCSRNVGKTQVQWVGGIAPDNNLIHPLRLQCCKWIGLRESIDRGEAIVRASQIVYGGEVLYKERLYAFDYISNIQRLVDQRDQSVYYKVSIRRFACIPRPKSLVNSVGDALYNEIVYQFTGVNETKRLEEENDAIKSNHVGETSRNAVVLLEEWPDAKQKDKTIKDNGNINKDQASDILTRNGQTLVRFQSGEIGAKA